MTRPLRIGFWNINGYNSSILGNKSGANDFMDVINKHDIFAIVETHVTHDAELKICNFKHFSGALAREARSEAPFFRKIGNSSTRENLVMTSAYERATKRTPSVQTLGVEEGGLVARLTGDLKNAIFSRRESEKRPLLICICYVDKRSGTLI